jgi:hypothetical protein
MGRFRLLYKCEMASVDPRRLPCQVPPLFFSRLRVAIIGAGHRYSYQNRPLVYAYLNNVRFF